MNPNDLKINNTMEIEVLGTGCTKCKTLDKLAHQAIEETGVKANVTKVEDIMKIMEYGVMTTPGLVINGKVVLSGKIPSLSELKTLIEDNK